MAGALHMIWDFLPYIEFGYFYKWCTWCVCIKEECVGYHGNLFLDFSGDNGYLFSGQISCN